MHRRESILNALSSTVTGLATTATRVERARPYAVPEVPALSIAQGTDERVDEYENLSGVTRVLNVDIIVHVKKTTTLETELNQIAAEVYAAITADRRLGLTWVLDANLTGDSAPDIDADSDQPVARLITSWAFIYEHSDTSAES